MISVTRPIYNSLVKKLTKQEKLSITETLCLLVEIRRYIEDQNLSEQYSVAKFYCDWALHSMVNRHPNSQYALNIINERFRNPNLPYESYRLYMQTILDAIQYTVMGKQLGTVIVHLTKAPFTMDNYLMLSILKCLIGIPIVPKDTDKEENKRKEIDTEINNEVVRMTQLYPEAILYNMLTAKEVQKRIVNFMFTDINEDDGIVKFMVEMEDGDLNAGFFQLSKA